MTMPGDMQKFDQIVQKIDPQSKLLRIWKLHGGISAQVMALEILRPDGQRQKMIVRQHGEIDLQRNPNIAADEFHLLHLLHATGLAVPTPYYLDQSDEILATPYIVIEFIEGEQDFAPANTANSTRQLATHLSKIHGLDCSKLDLSFLPPLVARYGKILQARPANMNQSLDEGSIRDVLEAAWPLSQQNSSTLLHGDFWPGNTLWKDGVLAAIIDWEDVGTGDPLVDIANARLEILWAFGIEAMQLFTQHYQSLNPIDFTNLPYWDLCAALRPISKAAQWSEWVADEQAMREGHKWFVAQAFAKLSTL